VGIERIVARLARQSLRVRPTTTTTTTAEDTVWLELLIEGPFRS